MKITFNNSELLIESRPIIMINNQVYPISVPESKILQMLIENKNTPVDKNTLVMAAWEHPDFIGPNSLAVAISNIRKIIKHDNVSILNIPKVGYKLTYKEEIKEEIETTSVPCKNKEDDKKTKIESITLEKENRLSAFFLSSPVQIIIFSLLTYFTLNVIHSWVIIR